MAAKIRLQRIGRKNKAFYRIVVANERSKRNGKVIDQLGFYDPKSTPATLKVDNKNLQKWLTFGAQPTEVIRRLLKL